jgi:hypothetical protein
MDEHEKKAMAKSKLEKQRDPLPQKFNGLEEAVGFWDTHSLADYEEYWKDVRCEIDIKQRTTRSLSTVALYEGLCRAARAEEYGSSLNTSYISIASALGSRTKP